MEKILTLKINKADRKFITTILCLAVLFVTITMLQDVVRSGLNHSSFYFSESFMFSSFWWIFVPLLIAQYFVVKQTIEKWHAAFHFVITPLFILFHLLVFPLFVQLLSGIFYYHTFEFAQTFRYALSEHLYLLVLLYSVSTGAFLFFPKTLVSSKPIPLPVSQVLAQRFISTIVVSDGNKKYPVPVGDILYFSANTPYINIHLAGKKYLHHETLRSVTSRLNPENFVRVHKSTIVNIRMVASYTSRLNGDYDLTLQNNSSLRVSRNFAAAFKSRFSTANPVTNE